MLAATVAAPNLFVHVHSLRGVQMSSVLFLLPLVVYVYIGHMLGASFAQC